MLPIFFILSLSYIFIFILSVKMKDNSIVDVFWGFWFILIAGLSFLQSDRQLSQVIVTWLVFLWWTRIFSHIGFRKLKERKEDARYAKWREEWGSGVYFYIRSFLQVYILQMILLFLVSTAIFVVNFLEWAHFSSILLSSWFIVSLLWLGIETTSDIQLSHFMKIKKPGEIFKQWFYKYSRHPNYFWESIFWLGISIISVQYSYIGVTSWILITFLLLFVSWVPLQESRYEWRPEWEEYKNKTSVFIPWFPRK